MWYVTPSTSSSTTLLGKSPDAIACVPQTSIALQKSFPSSSTSNQLHFDQHSFHIRSDREEGAGRGADVISKTDPLLAAAKSSVDGALGSKSETKPLMVFISGSARAGSHRLARHLASCVNLEEQGVYIDARQSLTERVQGWLLRSVRADWRFSWCGIVMEKIILSEAWRSRFLPSDEAALKLLSNAMRADRKQYRIVVTGAVPEDPAGKELLEWVHAVLVASPQSTAIVSSSAAPFGVQRLVECLGEVAGSIPFAHVRVRDLDQDAVRNGDLDPSFDDAASVKRCRVDAVLRGVADELRDRSEVSQIAVEGEGEGDVDDIVRAVEAAGVGFRLENLIRMAKKLYSSPRGDTVESSDVLQAFNKAMDEVIDEEIERLFTRFQAGTSSEQRLELPFPFCIATNY